MTAASDPSEPITDFSYKPTLDGEKVTLVPQGPEHAEALHECLDDPEVNRLTGTRSDFTLRRLQQIYATRPYSTNRLDLTIIDKATGECVGEVVLNEWDPDSRKCNYRIAIGPKGQGRGLGTEAGRLIVGYGIEKLHLNRISLGVYDFNPRALRSYERIGFVHEGIERQSLRWDGEYHDQIFMAVLAEDWKSSN